MLRRMLVFRVVAAADMTAGLAGRKWTHESPIFRHSSHPAVFGDTLCIWFRCEQDACITDSLYSGDDGVMGCLIGRST